MRTKSLLESDRIILRAVEPEDAAIMAIAENDPLNMRYNGYCAPFSFRQLYDYAGGYDADPVRAGQLRLIVEEKDPRGVVGIIDFTEINIRDGNAFAGIYVFPQSRCKGLGREAVLLGSKYMNRILGLRNIGAKVASDNAASIRMFIQSGFVESGRLERWLYAPDAGERADLVFFQLDLMSIV